jgi:hypothetical protein
MPLYNIVETAEVGILIYFTVVGVYQILRSPPSNNEKKLTVGQPTAIGISVHRHNNSSTLTCFAYERKNIAPFQVQARKIRLQEP